MNSTDDGISTWKTKASAPSSLKRILFIDLATGFIAVIWPARFFFKDLLKELRLLSLVPFSAISSLISISGEIERGYCPSLSRYFSKASTS